MGLTMLRLLLLPVFLWVLLLDAGHETPRPNRYRWWAVGIFAVMAITDKLDGYLARRLNQTSKLGTILDPVADKLLIASSVVLLSFGWAAGEAYRIPLLVVAAVYGKDLVVVLGTVALLAVVGRVTVSPRPLGKFGTVLNLVLVLLTLLASSVTFFSGRPTQLVLTVLWWAVPIVAIATCADYLVHGIGQFRRARWGPSR